MLEVVISDLWDETGEIRCFELGSAGEPLPSFSAGAHVEVHLSDNLVRHYSLWNGPEQTDRYMIGVKREPESRGGSARMHELKVGDTIAISEPRNNFALEDSDGPAIMLAGGIGITPLLAMARERREQRRPTTLHMFARDADNIPFKSQLNALDNAPVHLGLVPPTLDRVLRGILSDPDPDAHLYMCGPGPFMDLVEKIAAITGWPNDRVHLERFSVDADALDLSGDSFEVVLRQSGQSITVGPDQTIIQAMEKAGIVPLTSCEQGVCGTCMTTVIDGEPDHRDFFLNDMERQEGNLIMPCVSRCKGKRLVLDL